MTALPGGEQKLRVLLVDDDEDDILLIRELIREGFWDISPVVDVAHSVQNTLERFERERYHICLFDYNLGKDSGLDLLRVLKDKKLQIPLIMLTGQGDEEIAVAALKAGASDYIEKSKLSVNTLSQSIRYALKLFDEEEQRRKAEAALVSQERLLQGVAEASNRLLVEQDYAAAIQNALAILAEAVEADRASILEHHVHPQTKMRGLSGRFFWKTARSAGNENSENIQYNDLGYPDWYDLFSRGQSIQTEVKDIPANLGQYSRGMNCPSYLLLPIFLDEIYWGVLGFFSKKSRSWSKNELSILKVASAGFGGRIKSERDTRSFRSIVEGTSTHMGEEFFNYLVRHLSQALGVHYVFAVEYLEYSPLECRVLAGWTGSVLVAAHQYSVDDSPCEEAMAGMLSFYPQNVGQFFSKLPLVKDRNVESYAAVPFFSADRKAIGHLVVMDDKPILDRHRTLSILKIFASRAGAELERKRAEETVKNMAYYDTLTGLPNRVLLNDRLSMAIAQATRGKSKVAIMYMDFDRFKQINDTLGHAIGDVFLQKSAQRLKACLRGADTLARLGGDEFILVQPQIHEAHDAAILGKKILESMHPSFYIEDHELKVTLSIGIAIFPDDGDNLKTVLKNADLALYFAKASGRDNFKFFSEVAVSQSA
jgi:diguanylate cyclase (GGDEF)-like protein